MTHRTWTQTFFLYLLATAMVIVGIRHFTHTEFFERIVPPILPNPKALVLISGVFEVLGGLGLIPKFSRKFSAWGCIALYIAVFPANIYHAVYHVETPNLNASPWMLWARLPLQFVLIAWAYTYTRDPDWLTEDTQAKPEPDSKA